MGLKDRIEDMRALSDFNSPSYYAGYRECQNQAAQLAAESDELMAEMAEALEAYLKAGNGHSTDFWKQGDARRAALYALDQYKDQTND